MYLVLNKWSLTEITLLNWVVYDILINFSDADILFLLSSIRDVDL